MKQAIVILLSICKLTSASVHKSKPFANPIICQENIISVTLP